MYKDYPKFAWFVVFAALALPFAVAFAVDRWGGPEDQVGIVVTLLLFEMALIRRVVVPIDSSFLANLRLTLTVLACVLATGWRPDLAMYEQLYNQRFAVGFAVLIPFAGWIFTAKENRVLGFSFDRNFALALSATAFVIWFNHVYLNVGGHGFAVMMDFVLCASMAITVPFLPMDREKALVQIALGSVSFGSYLCLVMLKPECSIWSIAVQLPIFFITGFAISTTFRRK